MGERNHGEGHSYTLGRIKEIRAIHKREVASAADAARCLRDETAIYYDILPGYKIKELTEAEKTAMKSKEVRNLQSVEQTILFYYRKFIGNLIAFAHKKSDLSQLTAVSCLCELLPVAQDFNFGSSLVETVVDKCNSKNPRLSRMCIKAVRDLLSSPTPTDAVLTCLQSISDSVKDRGSTVNHSLIASLLCVRIRIVDVHSRDLTFHKKLKQQQKKQDKELAKTLSKGEASLSRVESSKLQTKMLNKVLTTYLRALEISKTAPRYRQSLILGPTMEGLAKFAHMIDFSLFELLLKAIGDILDEGRATLAAMLNGIITVATLANQVHQTSSSSDDLTVDIAPYYEKLYSLMPDALAPSSQHDERSKIDQSVETEGELATADNATSAVSVVAPGRKGDPPRNTLKERTERCVLVLRACDLLLLQPKKVSAQRVSAFFRRLELCAVHAPPHVALGLLAFCRRLLQKYPNLAVLHDGGEETAGGAYDPEVDTPDHTNAMSSVSWDMTLHRLSYHPFLREYAGTLLRQHRGVSTNLTKAATLNSSVMGVHFDTSVKDYDTSQGGFNPLPPEVNKKMDRSVLKRHREAAAAINVAAAHSELRVQASKKRKVPKAAMETG